MKFITGEEAVGVIKPGDRVFVHGGAATPHFLLRKLADRAQSLWNVKIPNHRERLEREAFERFRTYEVERTIY